MRFGKKAGQLLLALCLTCFIIAASVIFTLAFRPLYYYDMKALDIPARSDMTEEEIRLNYDALIDYNMKWETDFLEFPTLYQSKEGQFHFLEVKEIFDLFKYMGIAAFLLSTVGILLCIRKKEILYLKYASILSVALPLFLGAFVGINWDRAFVLFHKIAFDNDFWLFDPRYDPVIKILPDEFFLHCALLILGGIVLGSLLCGMAYGLLRRKTGGEKSG